MKWSSHDSGGDRVEADMILRVLRGEAECNGVEPALRNHGYRSRNAVDGIVRERGGDGYDAAAGLLSEHLFYRELREVDVALEIG
jgi:hypothetical protein